MASEDGSDQPLLADVQSKAQGPKENSEPSTLRYQLFKFITGQSAWGHWYEEAMTLLVWLVVLAYIVVSVPAWEGYVSYADYFGLGATVLFALEYLVRLWTSCEDEAFGQSRVSFFLSFFSLVDLVTIVPYAVLLVGWGHHEGGLQYLRLLRLFQRFSGNKGCSAASVVVSEVASSSRWLLLSTTYFLFAIWLMVAAAYHLTERSNAEVEGRFDTFVLSMWWSLINLMGEYPLSMELSAWGRVVGVLVMVVAIGGVHGIPTGIITDGYSRHMEEVRQGERTAEGEEEEDEDAMVVLHPEDELQAAGVAPDSETTLGQLYLFINSYTLAGRIFEGAVLVVVVLNVVVGMLDTEASVHADSTFAAFADYLEPVSVVLFTAEYLLRFYAMGAHRLYPGWRRLLWASGSFYPLVDLVAIVPFYVDLFIEGDAIIPTTFVRVLRLFRIFRVFKAGRFVEGINIFYAVLLAKGALLCQLLYGTAILWVLCSVLMHYTERDNPIAEVAAQFDTMPRAMWVTLLNFTGEYPIGDYTSAGKLVSTFVAFVAIAIFGIPTAILSDGMAEKLERLDELKHAAGEAEEEEEEEDDEWWREAAQANESWVGRLFLILQGEDLAQGDTTLEDPWWETWGIAFEMFILGLILLNTVCFVLVTVPAIEASPFGTIAHYIEVGSVAIYTLEFLLRLLATFGDPRLGGAWYAPLYPVAYIFSFLGLVDVLAMAPWYIALLAPHSAVNRQWVVLRVVRLVRIERYLPVLALFGRVLRERYHSLVASVFVMVVCTIFFATLLHETERDNSATEGTSGYAMSYRFRSVPSSLFYTFLHLTGDYPLMKYSELGRVVNFVMIILAQGLVALPLGIIVEGFQSVLQEKVEKAEALRESWADALHDADEHRPLLGGDAEQGGAPGLAPDALSAPASGKGAGSTAEAEAGAAMEPEAEPEAERMGSEEQAQCWAALNESACFDQLQLLAMVAAVLGLAAHTDTAARDSDLGRWLLPVLQGLAAAFFAVEYALRLYACPADPKFVGSGTSQFSGASWQAWREWPRLCYASDFVGIVDLLAWLPYALALALDSSSSSTLGVALRMLQVALVLKFDRRLPAFTLLDDVVAQGETGRLLLCTAVLSLMLWVLFAAALYLVESDAADMDGSFADMPTSLFITMILIGGEWCRVDLEAPWGQLIGFLLALVGIGIIGIPMAVFFDGYSEIAEDYVDNYLAGDGDALCCGPCSPQGERSFCAPVNDCGERVDASLCKADATDHLKQDLRT